MMFSKATNQQKYWEAKSIQVVFSSSSETQGQSCFSPMISTKKDKHQKCPQLQLLYKFTCKFLWNQLAKEQNWI